MNIRNRLQNELTRLWALPCASGGNPAQSWHHRSQRSRSLVSLCLIQTFPHRTEVPALRVMMRPRDLTIGGTAWWHQHRIVINVSPDIEWAQLCQTLTHEVAHILVPGLAKHGPVWRRMFAGLLWEAYGIQVAISHLSGMSSKIVTEAIANSQRSIYDIPMAAEHAQQSPEMTKIRTGKRGRSPSVPTQYATVVQSKVDAGIHWAQALEEAKTECTDPSAE